MASLMNIACNTDVKKKGSLLKIKTAKKKLFILRDESASGPARLEYYDSAKKFKSGAPSRRSIVLRSCFSINAKSDNPRYPFAIVLYTTDDCFVLGCESDCERQEWLKALLELRHPGHCSASSHASSGFRHVWPVTVHSSIRGATESTFPIGSDVPSGEYRLCISSTTVSLQSADGQRELFIPLNAIRCCGHGDQSVFIEICQHSMGSSYMLNYLLLNAEDAIIAHSIHDSLANLLNSSLALRSPFRSRAHTSVEHAQRRNVLQRRDAPPCGSLDLREDVPLFWSSMAPENANLCQATDEMHIADDYMVMTTPTDEGYLDMSAAPRLINDGSLTSGIDLSSRLDVVQSFVVVNATDFNSSDEEVLEITDLTELPKRAYSVGSKPLSISHSVMSKAKVGVASSNSFATEHPTPEGLHEIATDVKKDSGCERSRAKKSTLTSSKVSNRNIEYDDEPSEVRPRTSTFPWDLPKSRGCLTDCLDAQRPRSVSNGNWMQIRDKIEAVKRRISNGARGLSVTTTDVDNHYSCEHRLSSSADGEYVEMKCTNIDYVDMSFGSHAKR